MFLYFTFSQVRDQIYKYHDHLIVNLDLSLLSSTLEIPNVQVPFELSGLAGRGSKHSHTEASSLCQDVVNADRQIQICT